MQKETGDKFSKKITWRDQIRRSKIGCKEEIKKGRGQVECSNAIRDWFW